MNREAAKLCALLNEAKISLSPDKAEILVRYLDRIYVENERHNLTRIARGEATLLQLYDSLMYLHMMNHEDENSRLLDIGTGAGFPGVPLAVALGCDALLVDSVRKKTDAIGRVIQDLGVGGTIEVAATRVEDLARTHAESFDAVVARAVADTSVLLEYAYPLLVMGGGLILSKAPLSQDEIAHAELVSTAIGMSLVSRETIELPEGKGPRVLLRYEKTGTSSIALPRRAGMATKRPLYAMLERRMR